jgi:hypothetical protein
MELVITERAPAGTVFAPDAFASQIGTTVPFKLENEVIAEARIIAVVVSDDGTEAVMTFDAPTPEVQRIAALMLFDFAVPGASFAFTEPRKLLRSDS